MLPEPVREDAERSPRRSSQRTFTDIWYRREAETFTDTETAAGYRGEVVISRLIEAFCGFKYCTKADIFCY